MTAPARRKVHSLDLRILDLEHALNAAIDAGDMRKADRLHDKLTLLQELRRRR